MKTDRQKDRQTDRQREKYYITEPFFAPVQKEITPNDFHMTILLYIFQ